MFAKELDGPVQGEGLHRVSPGRRRGGFEKGIVDRLLRRLDYCKEER